MEAQFVPVSEELRCRYTSKRCENPRTHKKNGTLHKFCHYHRERANRNQKRLDQRRRQQRLQAKASEERVAMQCPEPDPRWFEVYCQPTDVTKDTAAMANLYSSSTEDKPELIDTASYVIASFDSIELEILRELLLSSDEESNQSKL